MTLPIEDTETERIVRELASLTGETVTLAIHRAVEERLHRLRRERGLAAGLLEIGKRCGLTAGSRHADNRRDPPLRRARPAELMATRFLFNWQIDRATEALYLASLVCRKPNGSSTSKPHPRELAAAGRGGSFQRGCEEKPANRGLSTSASAVNPLSSSSRRKNSPS